MKNRLLAAALIALLTLTAAPAHAQRPTTDCPDPLPDGSCAPQPTIFATASSAAPQLFTVTTTTDELTGDCTTSSAAFLSSGGDGLSLREAICLANRTTDLDTIQLEAATYALSIAGGSESNNLTGDLDITQPITLEGNGATLQQTTTDRALQFWSNSDGSTLRDLIVTGGDVSGIGGGVNLNNGGLTTFERVELTGNTATAQGGGLGLSATSSATLTAAFIHQNTGDTGGGVGVSTGLVTLQGATVYGNTATNGGGVGLGPSSTSATLSNTTLSDNTATADGGGLFSAGGTLSLTQVTLAANNATTHSAFAADSLSVTLVETIVAGNTPLADQCDPDSTLALDAFNLLQVGSGCDGGAGTDDIITGQTLSAILDETLADNGGPTLTHALLAGSAALDAGTCTTANDQRGVPRPQGAGCDIGAVERYTAEAIYTVTSTANTPDADPTDLLCDDGSGQCTLRAAVQQAEEFAQGDTIVLGQGETYALTGETLVFSTPVNLRGQNATLDGAGLTDADLIRLTGNAEVAIDGLTLRGATDDGIEVNDAAVLVLINSVLTANGTGYQTRLTTSSSSTLRGVTIADNLTYGLASPADLTLENSIVWGSGSSDIFGPNTSTVTVRSSNVGTGLQAAIDGGNNTSLDPLFVNAAGGDYALLPFSPLVDAGNGAYLPNDFTDRDGDTITLEQAPYDLPGADRVQGAAVEQGAHELNPAPFADVPTALPAPFMEPWVETYLAVGLTSGKGQCEDGSTPGPGELLYCPADKVTRGEMAVFILRAMEYPALPYDPPGDPSDPLADVFAGSTALPAPFMEDFIEEFFNRNITGGKTKCINTADAGDGETVYCPKDPVTRGEMAVFILRALEYPNLPYDPPGDPTDPFADVFAGSTALPAPFMEDFIEEFYAREITGGKLKCENSADAGPGELVYCPADNVTRGEMAVFILRAFDAIPDPAD